MDREKIARRITEHYAGHSVMLKLVSCKTIGGERLIFHVKLKKGSKVSEVFNRAEDIRTALGLPLLYPYQEGLSIYLAVSERPVLKNSLRRMLENPAFHKEGVGIPIALGYDIKNTMRFMDLANAPHILIGGATGSGKTVGLRNLIVSIVSKQPVSRVNLILIETGTNGFDLFQSLPHVVPPIAQDEEAAVKNLLALVLEMKKRTQLSAEELRRLPAIVGVIDEYASLITNIRNTTARGIFTDALSELLRKGRHAKIHIVLATQEAAKHEMQISLNNIPIRIAFSCTDSYGYRAILGKGCTEKLQGKGTMLFKSPDNPQPVRLQGAFMPTEEIQRLVAHIRSQPHDLSNRFSIADAEMTRPLLQAPVDLPQRESTTHKELAGIILWTLRHKHTSASKIKQEFPMGNRVNEILKIMVQMGIVTEQFHKQSRTVLPLSVEDISPETMEFLSKNGISEEAIVTAIQNAVDA